MCIQDKKVKLCRRNPDFSSKCRYSSTVSPLPQACVFELLLPWAGNFSPQKKPAHTQNWLLEQASTSLACWGHSPPGTSHSHSVSVPARAALSTKRSPATPRQGQQGVSKP